MYDYDVLVVGTGPAGQKAAIAAAKLRRRVAIVERSDMVGGVCVNTGTIPSKTMRETVLHLTGLRPPRAVRAQLPRQGGHHRPGPRRADTARRQSGDRRDP